ncbi:MAG: threonylcarbamoyl-AMP synthase [Betaproteobacteria bacterium]|nr:threonylcarbamoyl-AMP synthase [Betaproteobacteria bacterium]
MRVSLEQAIAELKNGGVVAIPTETVYGLAADATNDSALEKIFSIKQRPADHPLIVHIGEIHQIRHWATTFPETARKLALAFWPGPFTLVLPAQDHVSRVVRGGESTVALRIPNHPVARELLLKGDLCVAAPSANLFTQLSPTTPQHVENGLGHHIPVLDGGACQVGIESTIVSVTADGKWQLLRPGMIGEAEICRVAGAEHQIKPAEQHQSQGVPKVPGQHALHYSPHTPLRLFDNRQALLSAYAQYAERKTACAAMLIGGGNVPDCPTTTLPDQPGKAAELLYASLHDLDDLGAAYLLVELPPDSPAWVAVRDRLTRAGAI